MTVIWLTSKVEYVDMEMLMKKNSRINNGSIVKHDKLYDITHDEYDFFIRIFEAERHPSLIGWTHLVFKAIKASATTLRTPEGTTEVEAAAKSTVGTTDAASATTTSLEADVD
ncbi:hypothetical protein HDU85_007366 [Gaertneriomyces sp. JEL0708]|nr:hypothetical protein HDU85_007366 [Gaertneriomyces sp. JEL0708]